MIFYNEKTKHQKLKVEHLLSILDLTRKQSSSNIVYKDFFQKLFDQNFNFRLNKVEFICDFCGKPIEESILYFLQKSTCSTYGFTKICCKDKKCISNKKKFINTERQQLNQSPHQGCSVSEERKQKKHTTMLERGRYKEASDRRKGKTYEEVYGESVAKIAKQKIKARRQQQEAEGKSPHLGKTNGFQTRLLMRNSRLKFLGENPDFLKNRGLLLSQTYWSKSEEERQAFRKSCSEAAAKRFQHARWGIFHPWYNITLNFPIQSSYEFRYYNILDISRVFYRKSKILIEYISPEDNEKHYYNPDIEILDSSFNLVGISEVKPGPFLIQENLYSKITRAKIEALKVFCTEKALQCNIITEKDLFNEDCTYQENYKDYQRFLSKC